MIRFNLLVSRSQTAFSFVFGREESGLATRNCRFAAVIAQEFTTKPHGVPFIRVPFIRVPFIRVPFIRGHC